MNKKTYTGSKIQNHFTAYLIQFVRGKRHDYLEKKIQMADAEIAGGTGEISRME